MPQQDGALLHYEAICSRDLIDKLNNGWKCSQCGHLMTEEESKNYRGCPTGVHAVRHVRAFGTPPSRGTGGESK